MEDYASHIARGSLPTPWETIVEIEARIGFLLNVEALRASFWSDHTCFPAEAGMPQSIANLLSDAPLEHRFQRAVVAHDRRDIGVDPFGRFDGPPTDFETNIDDDVLEQNALGSPVPFSKGVDHVEVTEMLSHGADQLRALPTLEPCSLRHGAEDLVGLRLDSADVAKACASLRDVDGAKIARPIVDIEKQRVVDMLQVRQIVGGKRKIDLASGNLGEITLGLRKQRIVLDAQPVTQYVRLRVAVRILAGAVLVQGQAGLR